MDNLYIEKNKIKKLYKQLINDKEQFKKDYNELKYMDKESESYIFKRNALKGVKHKLDSKINNINSCNHYISNAETMLHNFEKNIKKRIK